MSRKQRRVPRVAVLETWVSYSTTGIAVGVFLAVAVALLAVGIVPVWLVGWSMDGEGIRRLGIILSIPAFLLGCLLLWVGRIEPKFSLEARRRAALYVVVFEFLCWARFMTVTAPDYELVLQGVGVLLVAFTTIPMICLQISSALLKSLYRERDDADAQDRPAACLPGP